MQGTRCVSAHNFPAPARSEGCEAPSYSVSPGASFKCVLVLGGERQATKPVRSSKGIRKPKPVEWAESFSLYDALQMRRPRAAPHDCARVTNRDARRSAVRSPTDSLVAMLVKITGARGEEREDGGYQRPCGQPCDRNPRVAPPRRAPSSRRRRRQDPRPPRRASQ